MTHHVNAHGQPIGAALPGWTGCAPIPKTPIHGRTCDIVPLQMTHSNDLNAAFATDVSGALWTYMPAGPFETKADYAKWISQACNSTDPLFFAVIDKSTSKPVGVASYLRIQRDNGVVEVGYITFSPLLQRTVMATEAMYLMMKRAFDELGYRRYEWKCDALNAPSRRAAERLGFRYDGLFKQARVYKGRNRDTAWYSILDKDWPEVKAGFEAWLRPSNFDSNGQQRSALHINATDAR